MSASQITRESPAPQPLQLTAASLKDLLDKPGILVLDWWAGWCRPCRAFAPVFAAAAVRHPDIAWGKVDTEHQRELATAFGIQSIPTLMIFRDGVLIFSQPGMLPAEALDQLVAAAKALDMDELRRKLDAQVAQESGPHG